MVGGCRTQHVVEGAASPSSLPTRGATWGAVVILRYRGPQQGHISKSSILRYIYLYWGHTIMTHLGGAHEAVRGGGQITLAAHLSHLGFQSALYSDRRAVARETLTFLRRSEEANTTLKYAHRLSAAAVALVRRAFAWAWNSARGACVGQDGGGDSGRGQVGGGVG